MLTNCVQRFYERGGNLLAGLGRKKSDLNDDSRLFAVEAVVCPLWEAHNHNDDSWDTIQSALQRSSPTDNMSSKKWRCIFIVGVYVNVWIDGFGVTEMESGINPRGESGIRHRDLMNPGKNQVCELDDSM